MWQLVLPAASCRGEVSTDELSGSEEVRLAADSKAGGGKGETALQHAQLFRCPRDGAADLPQMKICIWMKNSGNL